MVGLLKYFHREPKQKPPVSPNPKSSLSEEVPSSSVELTSNIICNIQSQADKKTTPCQHGEYLSLTSTQKFLTGKRVQKME